MRTLQEQFDIIVKHLYKQGRPARALGGGCFYRHTEGPIGEQVTLSCAVGCLIPDDVYDPLMDKADEDGDTNFFGLLEKFPKETNKLPEEFYIVEHRNFYKDIQELHDFRVLVDSKGNFVKDDLTNELLRFASNHGLKFNSP